MSLDEVPIFRRYVEKPIEACLLTADNIQAVAEWCSGEIYDKDKDSDESGSDVSIDVGSKMITADIGDYIVKTSSGSFFRIDAEKFEAMYEQIWW